jgi:CRP-like cAMP-binding protein
VNGAVLRTVPLFADVPEDDLDVLAAGLRRRRYGRGQVIFVEGDPGTNLCIVEQGSVRMSVSSEDGRELVLRMLRPPDFFGELALLDGEPRSTDAIANEPSQLLLLERSDFVRFVESRPRVALALLAVLSRKIRLTSRQAQDVAFLDVPARVARTLLELSHPRQEGQLSCDLTQTDLARIVGATRESVNKWLGYFERQGLVRRGRGTVAILKPELLRRRA